MTHEEYVFNKIEVTRSQIINCTFSSWYPKYKKHTPKARIIKPLPQAFIDYLSSDGIDLPQDGHYEVEVGNGDNQYSDWSDDESEVGDDDDDEEENKRPPKRPVAEVFAEFQAVHDEIKSIIKEWGPVTPKLNWSAPQDATWIMATNTMKCENASDVYLILNASNYIMHDISNAFSEVAEEESETSKTTQQDYELILRKWFNINPALEFRVYVKHRRIVGITQRDLNYYDFLENLKSTFKHIIDKFFEEVLADTFPDDNFVFDVYLPRPFEKVYLIDINPFSRKTDPLLYTWHELSLIKEEDEVDYEIRLITETNKGRFAVKEHSENQVPQDVVDASLDSSAMAELAKEWQELQLKAEQSSKKNPSKLQQINVSMEEEELGQDDLASLPPTILILNSDGRRIGGLCLELDSGCLNLIGDVLNEQKELVVNSLLTKLRPTRVIVSVRLEEGIHNTIKNQSSERNFTFDVLGSKSFALETSKKCIENLISSLSGNQNGLLYCLLTELKYSQELSMAKQTISALKTTIDNLETNDEELHSLQTLVQTAEIFTLSDYMYIDTDSLYALQIFREAGQQKVLANGAKTCLFDIFDTYVGSPLGHKKLLSWFYAPLANKKMIENRLSVVDYLISTENSRPLEELVRLIKRLTNINQIICTLQRNRMSINSWSNLLAYVEITIDILAVIKDLPRANEISLFDQVLQNVDLGALRQIQRMIKNVIDFESSKDWSRIYIRDGLNEELDVLKEKYNNLEEILEDCALEITRTFEQFSNETVNVVYIPQLGYLISVDLPSDPRVSLDVPQDWTQIFRTATNCYFKDTTMAQMDDDYGDIYQLMVDIEIEILFELQSSILEFESILSVTGQLFAEMDCFCSFATVAILNDFVKPEIVDDPILMIKKGRNLLIEQTVDSYISNDTLLPQNTISIITGANAAGKSVYLSQVGMIVFLSHIGCYVPASRAEIGLSDKILTRITTRESVDKCESTFFIDSQKMSKCLNLKTENSLLLIDEFGKGTDTLGGPAILGAIIESLASSEICSRTIITTHFHELFKEGILENTSNVKHSHMEVYFTKDNNSNSITYLYNLKDGTAENSFGIHCAEICGINSSIIKRAYEILESENDLKAITNDHDDATVNRMKVITREFLLWDIEKEQSTKQDLTNKLGKILSIE